MFTKIKLILLLLFSPHFTQAEDPLICDHSLIGEPDHFNERSIQKEKAQYEWLYDLLMPIEYQEESLQELSEKSFYVHFRESFPYYPSPNNILDADLADSSPRTFPIKGTQKYINLVRKKYRYDVTIHPDQSIEFTVRVHFRETEGDDIQNLKRKFIQAQNLWNASKPALIKYPYRFTFQVVERKKHSHFSVFLKDKTRGPYDMEWSRGWSHRTIAHELGHMVGLGDEYKNTLFGGKIDCLVDSFMCSSRSESIFDYHYYHILKRLF
ncbi:MAG: hypothetical protein AAF203_02630 [Pseudomonadota bacterium]